MTHFAWDAPHFLWLLGAVPGAVALAVWAERQRLRSLEAIASASLHASLMAEVDLRRRRLKTALILAAWVFTALAMAEPSWDAAQPDPAKRRDIIVLLDVSRSMLAEDLLPSRLEYARRGTGEFASRLRGDRTGLIAFAGSASLRCPLTTDYEFFETALDGASPDTVRMGGTDIAAAIRTAIRDGFDDLSRGSRHIVLITDAEDHGTGALAAAQEAARAGIRLSVVGLGDSVDGARIPVSERTGYLTYRGAEVWSRLNTGAVHRIAQAGHGDSLLAGHGRGASLADGLARLISGSRGNPALPRAQGFRIALALAILCLASELAISERRRA